MQHDGRSMPFDTLAREAVWNVTRTSSWRARTGDTVAHWIFEPNAGH